MPADIPITDLYDHTSIVDVAVDPQGERVAFVTKDDDAIADERRTSLFVCPADGSAPPHRLTRVSDASTPRFSPDGSKLGFLAAREEDVSISLSRPATDRDEADGDASEGDEADGDAADGDASEGDEADGDASEGDEADGDDEDPETQVWTFDLDRGGDARQVTTRDDGVADFDWAPDGDRLVVAARDPTEEQRARLDQRKDGGPIETERLQHKYDGIGWLDTVRTYLFVVDCASREATRLDDAHDGGGFVVPSGGLQPRWSPDGERIAFRSIRVDEPDATYVVDIYTIAPDGTGLTRVTDGDRTTANPSWSPDGSRLAYLDGEPENLYVPLDVSVSDFEEPRRLTTDLDRRVTGRASPQWIDAETLLVAVGDEGCTRICRLAADGSGHGLGFPAGDTGPTLDRLAVGGETAVLSLSDPREGQDVFAMDTDAIVAAIEASGASGHNPPSAEDGSNAADATITGRSSLTRLSAVNDDELERWPCPRIHRITYESDDGTEIEALVYAPETFDPAEPDPLPLVCRIHGGPMSYDEPRFSFEDAVWTSRGYLVVKPNYRGSTSYGRAFAESLRGRWNSIEVEDILAGVDTLLGRGWADPDRLFCTGFSQGGVNTAFAITKTDIFAAAAAEHGVYDLRSSFGTDDCQIWFSTEFGLPWVNPEAYDACSSIDDVDRIETPLLLTAGGQDWRCPPTQSEQLYVSLKMRGVPARLVVYPDEHHNIGDPDRAIHRLEELSDWFERFDPAREETD